MKIQKCKCAKWAITLKYLKFIEVRCNSSFSQIHKIGNAGIIAKYLLFPSLLVTHGASKYEIRYQ